MRLFRLLRIVMVVPKGNHCHIHTELGLEQGPCNLIGPSNTTSVPLGTHFCPTAKFILLQRYAMFLLLPGSYERPSRSCAPPAPWCSGPLVPRWRRCVWKARAKATRRRKQGRVSSYHGILIYIYMYMYIYIYNPILMFDPFGAD